MSADILADIAAYKRDEVRERRARISTAAIEAAAREAHGAEGLPRRARDPAARPAARP